MKLEFDTDKLAGSPKIIFALLAVFVVFSGANAFLLNDVSSQITGKVLADKELARPANLEIVLLTPENCADCFNIERALTDLKSKNVNVTLEKTISADVPEAKEFISAYGLETLPALVITGEINKSQSLTDFFNSVGKIDGDVALYTKVLPPFFDLKENSVKGRVKVVSIVDSACANCTNFEGFVDYLRQNGVSISESKEVEWNSADGKELLKKFNLTKAPALLVSEDISEYKLIPALMRTQLNATVSGGWFAMSAFKAPYREVSSGKVVGLAELILLKDKSCAECYNVEVNKNILARFGIVFGSEKEIDVSSDEGKALIEKYKIKKAPIILISPDGKYYEDFVGVWDQVGSVETDGWYVMRKPEVIGPVRDLETGKIIEPEQQSSGGHSGSQGIHWHPKLAILINGQKQTIPANIGMGSKYSGSPFYDSMMQMTSVHTHEADGVLHWEIMGRAPTKEDLKLGNFFQIWGKTFNKNCIFEFCAAGGKSVKIFVNGKENSDFENYVINDKDEIEIKYE